jgi:hypothetical protein
VSSRKAPTREELAEILRRIADARTGRYPAEDASFFAVVARLHEQVADIGRRFSRLAIKPPAFPTFPTFDRMLGRRSLAENREMALDELERWVRARLPKRARRRNPRTRRQELRREVQAELKRGRTVTAALAAVAARHELAYSTVHTYYYRRPRKKGGD